MDSDAKIHMMGMFATSMTPKPNVVMASSCASVLIKPMQETTINKQKGVQVEKLQEGQVEVEVPAAAGDISAQPAGGTGLVDDQWGIFRPSAPQDEGVCGREKFGNLGIRDWRFDHRFRQALHALGVHRVAHNPKWGEVRIPVLCDVPGLGNEIRAFVKG